MATFYDRMRAAWHGFREPERFGFEGKPVSPLAIRLPEDHRLRYMVLETIKANRAYAELQDTLGGLDLPNDYHLIRGLENPALQAVDYHVTHVLPGTLDEALPLVGEERAIFAASLVFLVSNFGQQKDALVEDTATCGDAVIKAQPSEEATSVRLMAHHMSDFTEFREDARRNAVYVRLDRELEDSDDEEPRFWTEVWDREAMSYAAWVHPGPLTVKLEELGSPTEAADIREFGHDFVPFVRTPFRMGTRPNKRSRGVFEPFVEPIDHLNRLATELDGLYRENAEGVFVALRNEAGKDAIEFRGEEDSGPPEEHRAHGRRIVRMPGASRMDDLVPSIDYKAGLEKENARRLALERSLAELRHYRGFEGGDPSAAAIRLHQAPAIARARAARANVEEGILKGLKMAFTIAQGLGLEGFSVNDIGRYGGKTYESLGFVRREIVPESTTEVAERRERRARTLDLIAGAGLLAYYLEDEEGLPREEAERIASSASRREGSLVSDLLGG